MSAAPSGINPSSPAFVIERTLDAPRDLVWDAWTSEKHLKQWFGPKGIKIVHSELDLKPDGFFLYGMQTPDGSIMWGKWVFREIVRPEKLVMLSMFSNEKGGVTRHPMAPDWPLETMSTTTFTEHSGKTTLRIEWRAWNATDVEQKTFDAGHDSMTQGWGGTFDQLADYLSKQKKETTA